MINYFFEEVSDLDLDTDKLTRWINNIIQMYKGNIGDITFVFCNDEYILKINREYLDHDYYTDIITFDYCVDKKISGDLFISLDTIQSNSTKFNTTYEQELYRVIIHGILHLLGFKDKTEEESSVMRQLEDKALAILKTF